MNAITTTHKLDFEAGPYEPIMELQTVLKGPPLPLVRFRVGTCEGVYWTEPGTLNILAVENSKPGNGHFDDVLEWFEYSAKQRKVKLVMAQLLNKRLEKHLITKRGFTLIGDDAVKDFSK